MEKDVDYRDDLGRLTVLTIELLIIKSGLGERQGVGLGETLL